MAIDITYNRVALSISMTEICPRTQLHTLNVLLLLNLHDISIAYAMLPQDLLKYQS